MHVKIKTIAHPFLDRENFTNWLEEENLNNVYNTNNLKILTDFNFNVLKDKTASLEVLNTLNLIQDFYIQIKMKGIDEIFYNDGIVLLKDFIYDNHFWKKRKKNRFYKKLESKNIVQQLKDLYDDFFSRIDIMH